MRNWLKAAAVGIVAALLMFVAMMVGIHVTGIAPFQMPPSAAFLETLGLNVGPLALVVHFGYGAFWAVVLVAVAGPSPDVKSGLGLATGLWLFMMLVLSPLIGWGIFGTAAGSQPADSALYLASTPKYVVMTLALHVLYGVVVGGLGGLWIDER